MNFCSAHIQATSDRVRKAFEKKIYLICKRAIAQILKCHSVFANVIRDFAFSRFYIDADLHRMATNYAEEFEARTFMLLLLAPQARISCGVPLAWVLSAT